jgi:hypothetical protein
MQRSVINKRERPRSMRGLSTFDSVAGGAIRVTFGWTMGVASPRYVTSMPYPWVSVQGERGDTTYLFL